MNNINCTCPHCSHSMQLPETLVGKQGKCPSCGKTIKFQQPLSIPPVGGPPLPPSGSLPQPENRSKDAALAFTSAVGTTAKKLLGHVAWPNVGPESLKPTDSTLRGNNRYPNLSKYLALSDMLIKIAFIIGLVILALGVIIAFFHGLRLLVDGGIYIILAIPVVAPLLLLFLWLWRMTALATTEFVRVIMDIEQNTRNI